MTQISNIRTAHRVIGDDPVKVLLLHAMTVGLGVADREGVKKWWGQMFRSGAHFAEEAASVWTPKLFDGCTERQIQPSSIQYLPLAPDCSLKYWLTVCLLLIEWPQVNAWLKKLVREISR